MADKEAKGAKVGVIAFAVGIIAAIVLALFFSNNTPSWTVVALAILGLVVGILNVTDKETQAFLIATVAFIISLTALGTVVDKVVLGWKAVSVFLSLMITFIAPAALIVAIKALYNLARD